jgi:hypothetical protein
MTNIELRECGVYALSESQRVYCEREGKSATVSSHRNSGSSSTAPSLGCIDRDSP